MPGTVPGTGAKKTKSIPPRGDLLREDRHNSGTHTTSKYSMITICRRSCDKELHGAMRASWDVREGFQEEMNYELKQE